jgi:acetyltransferase-like isoleucine patch superfamily enzyme
MKKIKLFLSLILIPLPNLIKIFIYRTIFKYKIGSNVKIGLSWIFVEDLIIGDEVKIGNFNRFKNIPFVSIGNNTIISSYNHFTSTSVFYSERGKQEKNVNPRLVIGKEVGIALRHYFDIQDELSIGDFSTIAGIDSQFFTHQIDILNNCQSAKPISIGKYCMIGSGVKFSPGTFISDYTIVAMGSVVHGNHPELYSLIAGNPAKLIKPVNEKSVYFNRYSGRVD